MYKKQGISTEWEKSGLFRNYGWDDQQSNWKNMGWSRI